MCREQDSNKKKDQKDQEEDVVIMSGLLPPVTLESDTDSKNQSDLDLSQSDFSR